MRNYLKGVLLVVGLIGCVSASAGPQDFIDVSKWGDILEKEDCYVSPYLIYAVGNVLFDGKDSAYLWFYSEDKKPMQVKHFKTAKESDVFARRFHPHSRSGHIYSDTYWGFFLFKEGSWNDRVPSASFKEQLIRACRLISPDSYKTNPDPSELEWNFSYILPKRAMDEPTKKELTKKIIARYYELAGLE